MVLWGGGNPALKRYIFFYPFIHCTDIFQMVLKIFHSEKLLEFYSSHSHLNSLLILISAYCLSGAVLNYKDVKGRVKLGNKEGLIWREDRVCEGSCDFDLEGFAGATLWKTLNFIAGSLYCILVTAQSHGRHLKKGEHLMLWKALSGIIRARLNRSGGD